MDNLDKNVLESDLHQGKTASSVDKSFIEFNLRQGKTGVPVDILFRIFNLVISPTVIQILAEHEEEMKTKILIYIVAPEKDERKAGCTSLVTYAELIQYLDEIGSKDLITPNIVDGLFTNEKHIPARTKELLESQHDSVNLPIVFTDEDKTTHALTPSSEDMLPATGESRICLLMIPFDPYIPKSLNLFKCDTAKLYEYAACVPSGYPLLFGNFGEESLFEVSNRERFLTIFQKVCRTKSFLSLVETKKANELAGVVFYSQDCDLFTIDLADIRTIARRFLVPKAAYDELEETIKSDTNIILCLLGDYRGYDLFIVTYTKDDKYTFRYKNGIM